MNFWNTLIKTALLGTEKQGLEMATLPLVLTALIEKINVPDKETKFLKAAALTLNYEKAGRKNVVLTTPFLAADAEIYPFCGDRAVELLKATLKDNWTELLQFWIIQCAEKQLCAPEEFLHEILIRGKENIDWQDNISKIVGNRGKWLAQFNKDWAYLLPHSEEEIWQEGSVEDRKLLLKNLRQKAPEQARILLQSAWKEENANNRVDFLAYFAINLSMADQPMLAEIMTNDRSQKTRLVAAQLLKTLPESQLSNLFWEKAAACFTLSENKKKINIELQLPDTLEEVFKQTGYQKKAQTMILQTQKIGSISY